MTTRFHVHRCPSLLGIVYFLVHLGLTCHAEMNPFSSLPDLGLFSQTMLERRIHSMGNPCNQNMDLNDFYDWYLNGGLHQAGMNNVGNPVKNSPFSLNTHRYENEVIDYFLPLYGFEPQSSWGFITASGTDGNNHGMYFGTKSLINQTNQRPILYVSEEAHHSIKKLGDLQNLELSLIPTDEMGRMNISEFERVLNPTRPALIVIAMGNYTLHILYQTNSHTTLSDTLTLIH